MKMTPDSRSPKPMVQFSNCAEVRKRKLHIFNALLPQITPSTLQLTFTMPPHRDIEPYRDAIIERRNRVTLTQTLRFLNELIAADGGRPIGRRTLEKQLSDWGVTRSTAHSKLMPFKNEICRLYLESMKIDDLYIHVINQLQQNGCPAIGKRTLYTQLREGGLDKRLRLYNHPLGESDFAPFSTSSFAPYTNHHPSSIMAEYKVAVLDDYQSLSKTYFSKLDSSKYDVTVFRDTLLPYNRPDTPQSVKDALVKRLEPFQIICMNSYD